MTTTSTASTPTIPVMTLHEGFTWRIVAPVPTRANWAGSVVHETDGTISLTRTSLLQKWLLVGLIR